MKPILLPAASEALTLTVLAGLHHGATTSLDRSDMTIGSDERCDVVLLDPGVAAQHARIRYDTRQQAIIAAQDDDLVLYVEGRTQHPLHVPKGHGVRCRLPVELAMGPQVRLKLLPTAPVRSPHRAVWWQCGGVAAAALLLSTLAYALSPSPPAPLLSAEHPATAQPLPPTLMQLQEELEAALQRAQLTQLRVSTEEGVLQVSGPLADSQQTAWQKVRYWLDSRSGSRLVVMTHFTAPDEAPPSTRDVAAVWFGPSPYVVGSRGNKIYPGQTLTQGWVIDAIEMQGIRLHKHDRHWVLTL
ncbi:FHA domain-containing protein [Klebsiella pneumoniae]|uniref:SctD/MshK family protein n=1 Tax=Klebsiella pneumoniae TaxID=573 RepID=UPI0012616545|nr:FHA domain-containing protein [Klebsiella pneumoniae]KAB7536409.1 FHA domain-containing protein [Klebsiella pneumoniae]